MPYTDPKTKLMYPSQEWMFANIKNLPEVQKAYPERMAAPPTATPVSAPVVAPTTPTTPTTTTIPTGAAAVGKQVTIGGQLYPSQEWYDVNVAGKTTPIPMPMPTADIAGMQQRAKDLQEQINKLTQVSQAAEAAGYGAGTGKEIPAELFEQVGITPDTFDVSDNEIVDTSGDSTADLTAMISSWGDTMKDIQTQQTTAMQDYIDWQKEEKEKTKKWYEGIITGFQKTTEERPSAKDLLETTLADYGFTPETFQEQKDLISKITVIQTQLADIDVATATKIGMAESRGMPMDYIRGEKALINRQAASEKAGLAAKATAYAAQSEMLRGNMNQALTMATTVVNAATQDYQQEVNDFKFLMDTQGDLISALSDADRNMFETVFAYNDNMLSLKRAEETQKMNLVIDAAGNGIILPYTPDMTLQEMTELYSKAIAPAVVAAEAAAVAEPGVSPVYGRYRDRLENEIKNLYGGVYGTEGAREQAINILQREFPGIDVAGDVYARVPDGWEKKIPVDDFTSAENYILKNIQTGATSPDDMATIYSEIQRNTGLNISEIKGLLGKYGMSESGGFWTYLPTTAAREAEGAPPEEAKEESIWSKIWQTVKSIKFWD